MAQPKVVRVLSFMGIADGNHLWALLYSFHRVLSGIFCNVYVRLQKIQCCCYWRIASWSCYTSVTSIRIVSFGKSWPLENDQNESWKWTIHRHTGRFVVINVALQLNVWRFQTNEVSRPSSLRAFGLLGIQETGYLGSRNPNNSTSRHKFMITSINVWDNKSLR